MDKIKDKSVYILLTSLVLIIIFIITFIPKTQKDSANNLDTSMFNVVDTKEVLDLIKKNEPKMVIIGSRKCNATKEFISSMQISQAKGNYIINYIELLDENVKSTSYKNFLKELEVPYNGKVESKKEKIIDYMGYTPMILIIKNKKIVYGNTGTMSSDMLTNLAYTYGVA